MEKKFLVEYDVSKKFEFRVKGQKIKRLSPLTNYFSTKVSDLFRTELVGAERVGLSVYLCGENLKNDFLQVAQNHKKIVQESLSTLLHRAEQKKDFDKIGYYRRRISFWEKRPFKVTYRIFEVKMV